MILHARTWIRILSSSVQLDNNKSFYHMTRTALRVISLPKPLMKGPYEGRTHLRAGGSKKAIRPYYNSLWPRVLKFETILSPDWSYDKLLS